jgi:endoglycosylceramidase
MLSVVVPILSFIYKFVASPKKGKTKYFHDKEERILFFHGVNICNSSKWAIDRLPWHKREDYEKLKKHGFNLVRFLIYWEAFEPEKGKYNLNYIRKVKEHIAILNNLDISVILDVHQDLYNSKFLGNGFPNWTLPKKEYPFKANKIWYKNYLKKAVIKSYEHFWSSISLKKCYTDMLMHLQEQFIGIPNIIGIDVMNEPFPILPRFFNFERKILAEFYQYIELTRTIKAYKIPFFYGPAIWGSTGIPSLLLKNVYTHWRHFIPHYYPPFCHYNGAYNTIDKWLMNLAIRSKAREAQIIRSPFIIGEFGLSASIKNKFNSISDFSDLADKYHMSWLWWSYDKEEHSVYGLLDTNGNPNATMKELTRAYPQKVAGLNPVFYNSKNTFYIEYTCDTFSIFPTEIFIPGRVLSISTNTLHTPEDTYTNGILQFYQKIPGKQIIEIIWRHT